MGGGGALLGGPGPLGGTFWPGLGTQGGVFFFFRFPRKLPGGGRGGPLFFGGIQNQSICRGAGGLGAFQKGPSWVKKNYFYFTERAGFRVYQISISGKTGIFPGLGGGVWVGEGG